MQIRDDDDSRLCLHDASSGHCFVKFPINQNRYWSSYDKNDSFDSNTMGLHCNAARPRNTYSTVERERSKKESRYVLFVIPDDFEQDFFLISSQTCQMCL
jgi:hypothetical protein